jgi:hypothetical protein
MAESDSMENLAPRKGGRIFVEYIFLRKNEETNLWKAVAAL